MKMFVWNSKYLKQYNNGLIIVLAKNIKEARRIAIEKFSIQDKELYKEEYESFLNEDLEEIEKRTELFLQDIKNEPTIENILFIAGSA